MQSGYFQSLALTLDPDYRNVLDYATSQGIALPTKEQQKKDSDMLRKYKATGAWGKDDVFAKFKGTASAAFKLICWKRLIKMTAVGGLTWSDNGVEGNGTTGYINTLYNPALHAVQQTVNNAGYGWVGTKNPSGTITPLSAEGVNGRNLAIIPNRPAALNYYTINGGSFSNGVQLAKVGLNAIYRTSAASASYFADVSSVVDHASTGLPDVPVFLLANNVKNTSISQYSTENLAYFYAGAARVSEHNSLKTILI